MISSAARIRIGIFLAQAGCTLMILGGLGDQLVRELLPAHATMLGMPLQAVPPATARVVLALLHCLGYALIATGLAALVLLRQARASGKRQLVCYACGAALTGEGANALHMCCLQQPLFVVPLTISGLLLLGGVLAMPLRSQHRQAC